MPQSGLRYRPQIGGWNYGCIGAPNSDRLGPTMKPLRSSETHALVPLESTTSLTKTRATAGPPTPRWSSVRRDPGTPTLVGMLWHSRGIRPVWGSLAVWQCAVWYSGRWVSCGRAALFWCRLLYALSLRWWFRCRGLGRGASTLGVGLPVSSQRSGPFGALGLLGIGRLWGVLASRVGARGCGYCASGGVGASS